MTEIEKELNRRADIIIRQEKQIEIDAEQIRALQKQNGELTDRVKELEKENAELKAIVRNTKAVDESFALQTIQLTKAKEIIKYLLSFIQKENYKTRWDINIAEAEQFLSEVEK